MSSVNQILQNDPNLPFIDIVLRSEPSDADLARALERNPYIKVIQLHFADDEEFTPWPLLAHVFSTREKNESIAFSGVGRQPASILQFWEATQANASVKEIYLLGIHFVFGSPFFTSVISRLSIQTLSLTQCDMVDPSQRERGARALAATMNTESLNISNCDSSFATALLRNLIRNTSVKNLGLRGGIERNASSIGQLMGASTTLQRIEFLGMQNIRGEQFSPIVQGLLNSESIHDFEVHDSSFSVEATRGLQRILLGKRNLAFLSLDRVIFGEHLCVQAVLESISTTLKRSDSALRSFEYVTDLNQPFHAGSFLALLRAVAKSKLSRFKIGGLASQQQLQILKAKIPSMRIREIEVTARHPLVEETVEQDMLRAVKKNFSLRSVEVYFAASQHDPARPLFRRQVAQRKLTFYFNRNERLEQWVDNKTTLDRELWPDALRLAAQAGKDPLFTSLKSVLGSDYVKVRARRKRKRTQLCAP